MTDCIFCKIINGEIPSKKVYENDFVFAFDDINPKAKVHTLVVPKVHVQSLNELEDEKIMTEILKGVKETAKIKGINSYRLQVNTGKAEGQEVMHLHFHVLSNTIERT